MRALLFPGQGSQEVGMGRDAYEASAAARAVFDAADQALGFPLSKLCFEGPEDDLVRTENQQPAILTTSIALLRALEAEVDLAPAYVGGHSLGEYSALVAAGAIPFDAPTLGGLIKAIRRGPPPLPELGLPEPAQAGLQALIRRGLDPDPRVRGSLGELEAELRRGVGLLRSEPGLLHREQIRGLIYDVATRGVRTVVG